MWVVVVVLLVVLVLVVLVVVVVMAVEMHSMGIYAGIFTIIGRPNITCSFLLGFKTENEEEYWPMQISASRDIFFLQDHYHP